MKHDGLDWFRDLTRTEQRDHMVDVARLCVDAAPKTLARKLEIYFGED